MKRLFFFICLLGLAACDRPQYDLQMVCEDGAKGQLMVDAKVYDTRADLVIKRLTKELRAKAKGQSNMWLADHTWLYNQIPQIDDEIEVSLPINEEGIYEIPGKIKLVLNHSALTGGLRFTLWPATDNNLKMADGETVPDGEYLVGTTCEPVLYPVDVSIKDIPVEQRKEVKNCLEYLEEQLLFNGEKGVLVFDEKTGREMNISNSVIKEMFNGIELNHFYLLNARYYPDDVKHACEIANRLREYIATHIDSEYIKESENSVYISAGEVVTISCDDDEVVVIGQ